MVTNKNKMEIRKDEKTGDLYKNGDIYRRSNVDTVKDEQSESKSGGFSFHAKSTDADSSDVLITSRSNQQSQITTSPTSEFRYHANENVQFEVVSPASPTRSSERDAKSIKSQMSPDYNICADRNRSKQESPKSKSKTARSDEVSLSGLKNIKPPKHPVAKFRSNTNDDNKSREDADKSVTSPMPKKQEKETTSAKNVNASGKHAKAGILKNSTPERAVGKPNARDQRAENDTEGNNGLYKHSHGHKTSRIEGNEGTSEKYVDEHGPKSSEVLRSADENPLHKTNRPGEVHQSPNKHATTRLPPTGKTNSLVGNVDINHHGPPQSNRNNILNGKSNGTVVQQSNRRNGSDKRHISSIPTQKNDGSPSQSNRSHQRETQGENERMSIGSRNSNMHRPQIDIHRNISPRTDSTEYRIKNPRSHLMSPRTEKSSNSQTSSEIRARSKEFTFRWNAPSRNTSPEATEKSNSPSPKQYKPSARIQSFYTFLSGRAKTKKRKTITNNNSTKAKPEQNGILTVKNHHRDDIDENRPKTFVYLRSKASQRSAWDREPGELTYKPSTNGPGEISQAYIGEDSIREAEMNAKLEQIQQQDKKEKENKNVPLRRLNKNRPPWYENEYVLNRRQAGVYKNMSNAYGRESRKQREQKFVHRLAEYEVYKARQQWEELLERDRKKKESKERQMLQLNELRQRFEDEAYHRFHTQYVTSRVLEHEKMNRNEYGLPEDEEDEPENKAIIKRKKVVPKSLITEDMIHDIYKRKFNKMFDVNKGHGLGRRPKTPKMEGIDTVVIEEEDPKDVVETPPIEQIEVTNIGMEKNKTVVPSGNTKEKKLMVKDVIDDAKKQMIESKQKPKKTETSPVKGKERSSTPSLKDLHLDDDSDDDDMDDIFEKARRKYDLDVDE